MSFGRPLGNDSVDESAILGAGRPFLHSRRSIDSGMGSWMAGSPEVSRAGSARGGM